MVKLALTLTLLSVNFCSTILCPQRWGCTHPSSVSPLRSAMNLKTAPGIPLVKRRELVTPSTESRDWYVIYRPKTNSWLRHQNWKPSHQSTSSIKETYFGKFQGLIMFLTEKLRLFLKYQKINLKNLNRFQNESFWHVQKLKRRVILIWKYFRVSFILWAKVSSQ